MNHIEEMLLAEQESAEYRPLDQITIGNESLDSCIESSRYYSHSLCKSVVAWDVENGKPNEIGGFAMRVAVDGSMEAKQLIWANTYQSDTGDTVLKTVTIEFPLVENMTPIGGKFAGYCDLSPHHITIFTLFMDACKATGVQINEA